MNARSLAVLLLVCLAPAWGSNAPPATSSPALSSCKACHARALEWCTGRRLLLSRWLRGMNARNAGHHILFSRRQLRRVFDVCMQGDRSRSITTKSFYGALAAREAELSTRGGDPESLRSWERLMKQGQAEVPGFERLWRRGLGLLRLPPSTRGREVPVVARALRRPYSHVHLEGVERLRYRTKRTIHVGKVLLFFGGVNKTVRGDWSIRALAREGKEYRLGIVARTRGRADEVEGEVIIDDAGRMKGLEKASSSDHFYLKQAGTLFERGDSLRFGPFSFEKTIHVPRKAKTARKKAMLDIFVDAAKVVAVDGEPRLTCTFTVREKPDDLRDAFSLWGKGSFTLLPNGVVSHQEVRMKFRVRVLGLPIVKGSLYSLTRLGAESASRARRRERGPLRHPTAPASSAWAEGTEPEQRRSSPLPGHAERTGKKAAKTLMGR